MVSTSSCEISNLTHDCVRTNVDYDTFAGALLAESAEEGEVLSLEGLFGVGAFGATEKGLDLASEGRVIDLHFS